MLVQSPKWGIFEVRLYFNEESLAIIQKTSTMKKRCLLLTTLILTNLAVAQTTFQKTIGGTNDDLGNAIQQTPEGGYIIAGETRSYGVGNRDLYLD